MTATATKPSPKTNQKTWLDWQHELLPQLPDPSTDELISREEFLDQLRGRGVDVSNGTLAFWEKSGVLPRAVRKWRGVPQAFYPFWLLSAVAFVYNERDRDRSLAEIKPRMDAQLRMAVLSAAQWRHPEEDAKSKVRPALTEYVITMRKHADAPIGGVRVTLMTPDGKELGDSWDVRVDNA